MNTLEFDSLYLEFGMQRVLSSVYMSCTTGQIVGLLGRNGSGKSCMLQVVFGTMKAEFKSIRFNKSALLGNYLEKKVIAYLPQVDLLPPFISFQKAIELFEVDQTKIIDHFPELKDHLIRKSSEVSGGQRRLFEVLLILNSKHPFCLFDEPFSGLSPVHVERLKEIFKTEKQNKGIIITDHLHRHIRDVADHLYVLVNGKTYPIKDEEQLIALGYLNEL
jgi:ABC-type branched-subunit amino acid transport system ATPase component